jgi:hypothetical protein
MRAVATVLLLTLAPSVRAELPPWERGATPSLPEWERDGCCSVVAPVNPVPSNLPQDNASVGYAIQCGPEGCGQVPIQQWSYTPPPTFVPVMPTRPMFGGGGSFRGRLGGGFFAGGGSCGPSG